MMFAAFPIVFQQQRGWSPGIGGLAFLGVAVGMMAAVFYSMYDNARYANTAATSGGSRSSGGTVATRPDRLCSFTSRFILVCVDEWSEHPLDRTYNRV